MTRSVAVNQSDIDKEIMDNNPINSIDRKNIPIDSQLQKNIRIENQSTEPLKGSVQ